MRTNLLMTILLMGLLSVGFTLMTGEVYYQQTLDNRRQMFTQVVELEIHHLWDKLKDETESLALSVQSDSDFKRVTQAAEKQQVEDYLDEQFHRAYVTLGVLDLKKIIIYDEKLNKLFESTNSSVVEQNGLCASPVADAKKRQGAARFKVIHQSCVFNGELRLVTLVPVGGLRLKGYLSVIVNPLINLAKGEKGLGIAVRITNEKHDELFRSVSWPAEDEMHKFMLVRYENHAGNVKPLANFYFATDVSLLKQNLFKSRIGLISFIVVSTLVAMFVALVFYRRTIICPLEKINGYMKNIRSDRRFLQDELAVSGSQELVSLANELNGLTGGLSDLYAELEVAAFTDMLTGIPNRALLFDRLKQISLLARRDQARSEFMLMMMDLNKFKSVNDELGHYIGDELLKAVSKRLKRALRNSDTVARIGGDEFSIILYAVNEKEFAVSVAEKITAFMNEVFNIDGHEIEVGISIGIARFPYDGDSSEVLMHCADMAMYHSKRNKIPYVFYDEKMNNEELTA